MPFLGPALGYLTAMCSPGWGNLVAFDWNDLPVGREFDGKFLKNVNPLLHNPLNHILICTIYQYLKKVKTKNKQITLLASSNKY